jgi:6-phosphogluconolactonase
MTKLLKFGHHEVIVLPSRDALSMAVAQFMCRHVASTLQQAKNYFLSLSGGSTPADLYSCLASEYATKIDWQKMQIYFGDERYVPHDHTDSNYQMAWQTMLSKVAIPGEQVHAIPTDCTCIDDCVQHYTDTLALMPSVHSIPVFDMILLGMGDDGHTASLFPGTDILAEQARPVASVFVEKFDSWRISLTYPVLNAARQLLVLVSGDNKAQVLQEIMLEQRDDYPVARIKNPSGVLWYVDRDAAKGLID